ncbi:MAG TPA: VWA domain-containing protein [Fimbriiglobus sp.]|jgi:Ca-activated chloride channel family protein
MLSFATPVWLWFAPLGAVVAWWWLRRKQPSFRYSDVSLVDGLPGGRAGMARWGGAVGRGLVVALLAVACAGPRLPDRKSKLPAEGVALVLVVDVSGSMATADPATPQVSRLDAAKRAFHLLIAGGPAADGTVLAGRAEDPIALVTFAAVPETVCPLTLNHTAVLAALDALKPKEAIDAGTNIGDAIAEGLIRLTAAGGRRKVLILLTDGEHNLTKDGPDAPLKPRQAAQLAANLNIPIHTVDCGTDPAPGSDPDDAVRRADGKRVLADVAAMTGGTAFAAANGGEMQSVVAEIDRLERSPVEGVVYRRYHELYGYAGLAAAAVLFVLLLLEATAWRRINSVRI